MTDTEFQDEVRKYGNALKEHDTQRLCRAIWNKYPTAYVMRDNVANYFLRNGGLNGRRVFKLDSILKEYFGD